MPLYLNDRKLVFTCRKQETNARTQYSYRNYRVQHSFFPPTIFFFLSFFLSSLFFLYFTYTRLSNRKNLDKMPSMVDELPQHVLTEILRPAVTQGGPDFQVNVLEVSSVSYLSSPCFLFHIEHT
jgi:hypothetical protein